MIASLEAALPSIESQIDAQFLRCGGFTESATQITAETASSGIVYRVNPEEFLSYLQTNYGVSVGSGSSALGTGSSLDLMLTNIFSPVWQRSYGAPFSSDPYFSNGQSSGFQFSTDGSCGGMNNNLSSNYGSIQSINGNVINAVRNDGRNYNVNLGGCSRV